MRTIWMLGTVAVSAVVALAAQAQEVIRVEPGPEAQLHLQEALILVEPGGVVEIAEGQYDLQMGLSLDVDNVTVRGAGMDKTVLSFANQDMGGEGLLITSGGVRIEDLAVEDTLGDAIKANGSKGLTFLRVRTEWTNGPDETNGAYGLYPVQCYDVLIDDCVAIGASDAGIYVGQSKRVIVRNSRAEYNVAGIEIENCHGADVYGNVATKNTGGILVFDLPDIPVQGGRDVRVFDNEVFDNNTDNFAPEGNIVGTVPRGTGIIIMANRNVEIFNNEIREHDTVSVSITSYKSTGRPINDPEYDPYPAGIHIHGNSITESGGNPDVSRESVAVMMSLIDGPVPTIVWDGVVDQSRLVDGELPPQYRIYIHSNEGEVRFANLNLEQSLATLDKSKVQTDLSPHQGQLPPVKPVQLASAETQEEGS